MQIGMIEGATRIIGKSQGYMGLPIRDEMIDCAAIVAGAPVHVRLLGTAHPPIMLEVGKTPEE